MNPARREAAGLDAARLGNIRAVSDRWRGAAAAALVNYGMLCGCGLSSRQVARTLPTLIREIVAVDTVGLFWSDSAGAMIDAWVEDPAFLSSRLLHSGNRWRAQNPEAWPSFAANVGAGPGAGMLLPYQTPAFYESDFYAGSYQLIGARHILDAVIHDGQRPLGCMLLMRNTDPPRFTAEEVVLADAIARLTVPAFAGHDDSAETTLPGGSRRFPGGIVVIDGQGSVVFRNRAAHQSLWTLARGGRNPMVDDLDDDFDGLLQRFCGAAITTARRDGQTGMTLVNHWGDFTIRLEAGDGGTVVISFEQWQPFACHIATRIAALGLSARRVMVCWLLVMGLARKDIARRMGLGLDTVNEHVEAVFALLGVTSASDCIRAFSG